MVAKISSTSNLGGALGYNFHKVEAGEAKVLLVSGMSVDNNGNTDMNRALEDMQRLLPSSMRTKKTVFHASLNPHPDDKLSDEELLDIAAYYMEKMRLWLLSELLKNGKISFIAELDYIR